MAWNSFHYFLAILLVVTGSINTLSIKWADVTESEGVDGRIKKFNHPFFQSSLMFLGEFCCFLVFKSLYKIYSIKSKGMEDENKLTRGNRDFNPLILCIPAVCDMTGSSTMFVGLNLTYASSYQMLRGSVIVFVGLFSICFLHRRLKWWQWAGILLIIIGLSLVGAADYFSKQPDSKHQHAKSDIVIGDILIVLAQIVTALHMVIEEKFVAGHDIPPLQAVGWEGLFGFTIIGLLQIPFYFIRIGPPIAERSGDRLEDAIDAVVQISHSWELGVAALLLIISIAFFNFAGISISKELSATTRMVLDSSRTLVVWIFSLCFLGQRFHWLQLVGFIVLLSGMFLYNVVTFPCCDKKENNETEENITS